MCDLFPFHRHRMMFYTRRRSGCHLSCEPRVRTRSNEREGVHTYAYHYTYQLRVCDGERSGTGEGWWCLFVRGCARIVRYGQQCCMVGLSYGVSSHVHTLPFTAVFELKAVGMVSEPELACVRGPYACFDGRDGVDR